jgi:stearoyl-CoA desaturase (delta-9 desaturase)
MKISTSAVAADDCLGNASLLPMQQTFSQSGPGSRWADGLNWPTIIWLSLVHAGALAAIFTFSWAGLAAMLVLNWLTGSIGICLGYHRLFTHRSFTVVRPLRWLIAVIGSLAGQGSLIDWVADHRKHHALSDREGDPHSPVDGAWWSHVLWLMSARNRTRQAHRSRWAPDLLKEPVLVWIDRLFLPLQFVFGAIIFGLGLGIGGLATAVSLLVWGVFFRLVFVFHATWLVNSASHMWGYRNYETRDNSRNLWWVALLTYGEGWHNNHHAYPQMARNRHKWWEFDLTFEVIRLLGATGLAWDIVDGRPKRPSIKPDVHLSPATAPQIGRQDACAAEEDSMAAWSAEVQHPTGKPAEIVAPVAVAP